MTTNTAGATVIDLQSHPVWLAAQRRESDIAAAMRRHPSYQSRPEPIASGGAAVYRLGTR
ncbi:MAG TPA: hypothetical protein VIQ11_10710 [Mycobacterium sp.]